VLAVDDHEPLASAPGRGCTQSIRRRSSGRPSGIEAHPLDGPVGMLIDEFVDPFPFPPDGSMVRPRGRGWFPPVGSILVSGFPSSQLTAPAEAQPLRAHHADVVRGEGLARASTSRIRRTLSSVMSAIRASRSVVAFLAMTSASLIFASSVKTVTCTLSTSCRRRHGCGRG